MDEAICRALVCTGKLGSGSLKRGRAVIQTYKYREHCGQRGDKGKEKGKIGEGEWEPEVASYEMNKSQE